jgi:hypothetical protein
MHFFLEGYFIFFMVISELKISHIYSTFYCTTLKEVLPNHRVPRNHIFEMTLAYTMNIEEVNSFETQVPLHPSTWRLIPEDFQFYFAYNFTILK